MQGTWALHEAFAAESLDFFVLFSSLSGVYGQIGQANYAAANTFLDAFVQYRHGNGLPAAVLDIGVMSDVGYISKKPAVLDRLRGTGMHTLCEQELLDALQLAIRQSHPLLQPNSLEEPTTFTHRTFTSKGQLAIGLRLANHLTEPKSQTPWKRDVRMMAYSNSQSIAPSSANDLESQSTQRLRDFLSTVAATPSTLDEASSARFLAEAISKQLLSFIIHASPSSSAGADVDEGVGDDVAAVDLAHQSPASMGVDSLVSIEVRNWGRRVLGLEFGVLEIMNAASFLQLGEVAVQRLRKEFGGGSEGSRKNLT